MSDFAVIIPAAGKSLRYAGGNRSKLAELILDRPVLAWAAEAFLRRSDVAELVLAVQDEPGARFLLGELAEDPRVHFTPGGVSRAHSVQNALAALRSEAPYVAVHDGARPAASQELISRVFDATRAHGAAGPAMPVALTIKQANGPLPAPIERTIPRTTLWAMQTPQAMRRLDLHRAYQSCPIPLDVVTDDLQLLELAAFPVPAMLVAGEEANLKITTPPDLHLATQALSKESQ